jgi:hypothetical protein
MHSTLTDELVSAALDGELVDVEALREVLERADARETLAAFVLLRAAAAADRDVLPAGERGVRAPSGSQRRPRIPIGIAASLAAMAVAGSFWLGTMWRPNGSDVAGPPAQQGGVAQSRPAGAAEEKDGPGQPPTPSRRVQFELGTEWQPGS